MSQSLWVPGCPRPAPELHAAAGQREEVKNSEGSGELTEDEIGDHLSNMGTATGVEHVYLSLSVPGLHPSQLSALQSYVYLQTLEVPFSKIKDLSCVSCMPYLITLDASHNEISDFFGFQPPRNLKEVNFSHNHMSEMKDLSAYPLLRRLNLDYNRFREIRGLQGCRSLAYLSVVHNKLVGTRGLDGLPLKEISLRANQIQRVENMDRLWALQTLDLAKNQIRSLSGLQNLDHLGVVNLEGNLVREIKEATYLQDLPLLRGLNLQENPVQDQPNYRQAVVFLLRRLTRLDQKEVTVNEKVSAVNKFDPPAEVVAAKDHMTHLMCQLMQPQVLLSSTLPSLDTPYPMLVLTGPRACGKRELAHKLCQQFSDFFAYGTCHTTRSPYFGEVDGCDYHFVTEEEFQHLIQMGKFIETMKYSGHLYGLSLDAIEKAAREGLACCVHMELEGVRSLKKSHLEPRYVLLVPTDRETYAYRLRQRGFYSHSQIQAAVARIDGYVAVNREQPGYFDNVIPCDDLQVAYTVLSQVVRDYLGLAQQTVGENTADSSTGDRGDLLAVEKPSDQLDSDIGIYRSKVEVRTAPSKTFTETTFLHRRQQLAREALAGRSPGVYTQLFNRSLHPAPVVTGGSQAVSPNLQECSEDSRQESRSSSGLSSLSLARASLEDPGGGPGPDTERLTGGTPDAGQPTSRASTPGAGRSTRPGANARPVLPPIPSGRRTSEHPATEL